MSQNSLGTRTASLLVLRVSVILVSVSASYWRPSLEPVLLIRFITRCVAIQSRLSLTCLSDLDTLQLSVKNGGKGKPEFRVPALIFGSFFVPIGLL